MFDDQQSQPSPKPPTPQAVDDIFEATDKPEERNDPPQMSEAEMNGVPVNLPMGAEEMKQSMPVNAAPPAPPMAPPGAPDSQPAPPAPPMPSDAMKPAAAMPAPPMPQASRQSAPRPPKSHGSAFKIVFIILVALIIITLAFFLAYALIVAPKQGDLVESLNNEPLLEVEPEPTQPNIPPPEPVVVAPIDTDGDGLTDAEEAIYGTSPLRADTDNDGLTDYEEVKIYGTDPLDPDTDKDGYTDGEEVRAGYNPNGEGKLFELPETELKD